MKFAHRKYFAAWLVGVLCCTVFLPFARAEDAIEPVRSLREVCAKAPPENRFAFILEKFADDSPVTKGGPANFCSMRDYRESGAECTERNAGHLYWQAVDLNGDRHYDLAASWSSATPNEYNVTYGLFANCGDETFVGVPGFPSGDEFKFGKPLHFSRLFPAYQVHRVHDSLVGKPLHFSRLFPVRAANRNRWAGLQAEARWTRYDKDGENEEHTWQHHVLEFDPRSNRYRIVKTSAKVIINVGEERHPDALPPISPLTFAPEITLGRFPDSLAAHPMPRASQPVFHFQAQPSFPCTKAATRAEKAICADPELARQDALLALHYTLIRSAIVRAESRRLESDQRAWIEARDACKTVECLTRAYDRRNTALCNAYPLDPEARPKGARRKPSPDRFVFRVDGIPRGVPYRATFDDASRQEGHVGKGGVIDVERPRDAKTVQVIVYAFGKENRGQEWFINLDDKMENYMTPKGIQSRLKNLGFFTGEINGVMGRDTELAVTRFKETHDMPANPRMNNCVRVLLRDAHDL